MSHCFKVNAHDNVATMLESGEGRVEIVGEGEGHVDTSTPIPSGHKVALEAIPAGANVTKFGASIGQASRSIEKGEWVHLHNCASHVDERSQTLDLTSGTATDTPYD